MKFQIGDVKNKNHFRVGKFWLTLLDAYKELYEKIVCRMQEIHKQSVM